MRLRHDPARAAQSRPAKARATRAAGPAGGVAAGAADLTEAATAVFGELRAWRAAAAKEQGVPAYVIFHDATLRQIAAEAPSTLAELATVSGVGENKLAKYGQQILDLLASPPAAGSRS